MRSKRVLYKVCRDNGIASYLGCLTVGVLTVPTGPRDSAAPMQVSTRTARYGVKTASGEVAASRGDTGGMRNDEPPPNTAAVR